MNKEKEFKLDQRYEIENRLIDTDGVDNIKASSLNYIDWEIVENEGQNGQVRRFNQ